MKLRSKLWGWILLAAAALGGCGDAAKETGTALGARPRSSESAETRAGSTVESSSQELTAEMSDAELTSKFGWRTMHVVNSPTRLASGSINLLLIYGVFPNRPAMAHDMNYYDNLIFGTSGRTVKRWFNEVSNNEFTWARAGAVGIYHPVELDERLNYTKAIQFAEMAGFDFAQFDTGPVDGVITNEELSIIYVANASDGNAGNRWPDPPCVPVANGTKQVCVQMACVSHRSPFMSFTHELMHVLGATDLYYSQPSLPGNVNALSVMGGGGESNNEYLDSTASRHPDPYHKMRLGWTRPKVRTNTDSGTVLLQAPSTMSSTGISNESPLLIYEPGYDYNYYLIEYRGPYSFDDQITSRGVAIWEVVTDATTHDAVSPMPNGYVATGDYTLSAPNFVRGDSVMWTRNHGMFVPPWYDGYTSQTQMRLLDVPTSTSVNFRFGACPAAISCPSGKSYSTTLCRCVP